MEYLSDGCRRHHVDGGKQFIHAAFVLALLAGHAGAAGGDTMLRGQVISAGTEPRFSLSWDAVPGAVYKVQTSEALAPGSPWATLDLVQSTNNSTGPVRWMAPESLSGQRFYQLVLPQPEIFSVEPSFVDSSDSNAVLYLLGQCLPTNATVEINGISFTPTLVNSNGVWATIRLNGLPPGQPIIGRIVIIDNTTSNTVAALPVESPIFYGAGFSPEQLQGPPETPPASPSTGRYRGHVTMLKAHDDGGNSGNALLGRGHVTVLKAAAEAPLETAARGNAFRGHVTVLKSAVTGGGPDDDCDGAELIASTGELRCQQTDLVIPGRGLDFAWTRTYRSRTGPGTAQGHGWDFSYNVSLMPQPDGTVQLCSGNGRCDTFYPDGTNGWFRDEHFVAVADLDGDGVPERVTFADGGVWVFHPPGSTAAGKLARIEDRNQNTITLAYDLTGRLVAIVDTLNRTSTVAYSPAGQIASVKDFSGRVVRYEYDAVGNLLACISPAVVGTPNGNDFPGGKTNRYAYSRGFQDERLNHNLTACIDAKGQTWLQVVYAASVDPASLAFDVVNYLQRGTYREHLRRFAQTPSPANQFATVKSILKDGAGNVTECFYDSRQRCVRQLDYTGRANPDQATTETQNRPSGKLRVEDPDFFETRYEWNLDSLCTRVVFPRGNSTELLYQRAFNQNSARSNNAKRHDGDLRVLRERACCGGADTDGDGTADITERSWHFEYDPRLGSPAGPGNQRAQDHNSSRSNKSRSSAASGGGGEDEDCEGFVTRITDPRGSVTTASYDVRGNLLHTQTAERKSGAIAACDFDYDAHGRLVSTTHPTDGEGCRRVDTFEYEMDPAAPGFGYLKKATRDNGGLLCGTTDHFRLATSYEYDPRGNVTRCVDPRGFDTLWTYNALDQVTTRTTPNASFGSLVRYSTTFTFDANDNLVQVDHENRDATGALDPVNPLWTSVAEYDALNRQTLRAHELAHVVQQSSLTNLFFYDANDNLVLEQLPEAVSGADPNNVVSHQYDERNLHFRTVRAPGTALDATEQFDYDENGNCTRVSKVDSFTIKQTIRAYDGFDRCSNVTDPMGNVERFAFDANDKLTLRRVLGETNDVPGGAGNLRLGETRYEFDSLNRCVRTRFSFFDIFTELAMGDGESTRSFSFAPNGLLLSSTDDNGNTTRYAYDSAHRLSSITDPRTNVLVYLRDPADNITTVTSIERSDLSPAEQTFTTAYVFDGLSRCVSSSNNVGNVLRYAYDSRGNCVSESDSRGNETVRDFDGLSRCVATTNFVGAKERGITINTSHVEYRNNRCASTTDGNGNTTSFTYDSLDRCVTISHPDGTAESLVWSPRSNLSSRTDANGTVISNSFDLLDRCVRRDIAPAPGVALTTTFELFAYEGRSLLVMASNDVSMLDFSYDSLANREKAKQDCLAAFATFDGNGNRLSLTYPSGRIVLSSYDSLDRVTSVATAASGGLPPTSLASYSYDGPDRLARIARASGVNTRLNWNGLANPANASGDFGWKQISRVRHAVAATGLAIDDRTLACDPDQNKTMRLQTTPVAPGLIATATNTCDYDALSRLARRDHRGASVAYTKDFVLDANGNRSQVISNGVVQAYKLNNALPEPADFQMNQYSSTPFGSQQYDRNGNLVQVDSADGSTAYAYDYANRLVEVSRTGAAGTPEAVASFTYDALGRRISKTTYPPAPQAPVTTQFLLDPDDDGDGILEEHENGTLRRTHVTPHVFEGKGRLMMISDGREIYFHEDDLGNVVALTDAKGAVVERCDYDDYGQPKFRDADGVPIGTAGVAATSSTVGNPFLFRGMYWDAETQFYIVNAHSGPFDLRYLDPKTGRTTSRSGINGINGGMPNRISMNVTVARSGSSGACVNGACSDYSFAGDNPWSGGDAGSSSRMKTGTVKFFNESKSFGRSSGGGSFEVQKGKKGLNAVNVKLARAMKEEGGRHTPFHNKYRPQFYCRTTDVTGEIELEAGRSMSGAHNNPLFQDSGHSGHNPLYKEHLRPTATGVEMFRKILDRGEAGDNVGAMWRTGVSGLRGHRDVGGYRASLIAPIAMDKGLRF